MKRKYNREQRAYMLAKAHLETLESKHDKMEQKYIRTQNIVNADGQTPKLIYCIDNIDTFNQVNEAFSALPEVKRIWQQILEARELLKQAEENLISYGLSVVPAKERAILTESAKTNYTTRTKLIDLVMQLDTATLDTATVF